MDAESDAQSAASEDRSSLDSVLDSLEAAVGRDLLETTRISVGDADGRVLAESVTAGRDVPHFQRAAVDGYAVRAADTFGATTESPALLREAPDSVDSERAVRVHVGNPLPDGADAVVESTHVQRSEETLEVTDAVAIGDNVIPVGADVEAGERLYQQGHRLRPSDLGLLRAVDKRWIAVAPRPEVAVVPTGDELVEDDPGPGEIIEANGVTVGRLINRWDGSVYRRDIVPDAPEELAAMLETESDRDLIVTTGGSTVGERKHLPEVLADQGELIADAVAMEPGQPVAIGRIEETPVIALPGEPVACLVSAVQFLRPTIAWLQDATPAPVTTRRARLAEDVAGGSGGHRFVRVRLERTEEDSHGWYARPVATTGVGALSRVTTADGWVEIPPDTESIAADSTVEVQLWE